MYLITKSSKNKTNYNDIVIFFHNPGVSGDYITPCCWSILSNLLCYIFPDCGRPYMQLLILRYMIYLELRPSTFDHCVVRRVWRQAQRLAAWRRAPGPFGTWGLGPWAWALGQCPGPERPWVCAQGPGPWPWRWACAQGPGPLAQALGLGPKSEKCKMPKSTSEEKMQPRTFRMARIDPSRQGVMNERSFITPPSRF